MLTDARLLVAIASPRRRELLRLVWDGEQSAGDLHRAMPDVTFGAVSLQLRELADAGAVNVRRSGRNRWYRADKRALAPVSELLEGMWTDALWKLKLAAELEETRRGPRRARPRRRNRKRNS
jgi:DNA-binding transcriptional ArsR family regulator